MTVLSAPNRAPAQVATRRRVQVRPATELTRMTRYRGGTYSHTVDRIVFTDGTSARTDLIRLNPNLRAYSLDFTGIAPHQPSRYSLGIWSALPHLRDRGCEAEVDWILRHSYPMRSIAELSKQLRQAGYPLGRANISEHEAIAGAQAAIWYFTNGLALDTRPLNAPVAVHRGPGAGAHLRVRRPTAARRLLAVGHLGCPRRSAAAEVEADGVTWHEVSGSQLTVRHRQGTLSAHARRRQHIVGTAATAAVGAATATTGWSPHAAGRARDRPRRLLADRLDGTTATPTASCTSTTTCSPGRAKRASKPMNPNSSTPTPLSIRRPRGSIPSTNAVDG